jgi:hypothetical protein
MYGAKIFVSAGCRKREGELIVREEHRRSKLLSGRNDGVRKVVLIGPRHGGSDFYRYDLSPKIKLLICTAATPGSANAIPNVIHVALPSNPATRTARTMPILMITTP